MKHKILMTLALLITAVGGAWAQDVATPVISGETEFYDKVTVTITCATSEVDIYYTLDGSNPKDEGPSSTFIEYKKAFTLTETTTVRAAAYSGNGWSAIAEVTFTKQTGPKVTWTAATKTGTFTMPAYDVEIAPIYAPAAQWAKDKEVDQIPTAIEGIFAGTTDAIVKAGIVAMMGKTENPQGIVMYAVTSTNQATAPELSAFSATVPTAENIADEGADVLVWYYIQGANTPDGEEATAENTFNDSEICAEPIKVTVLPNKYDITFKAANDNTIEAGKATVKVGDAAATVTEGKLQGVKMGTKVTINAKNGYKFRKVEAKKGAATPSLNITNPEVGQVIGSDGKNYAYASLPTGVTAVAKICYVSGSNGLALALTDEGQMNYSTAQTTCAAHTPAFTGGTWKLASEDEWNSMISAAGSYSSLRKGFSSVGGTNMQRELYWSSTEYSSDRMCVYDFSDGNWYDDRRDRERYVRACLAF